MSGLLQPIRIQLFSAGEDKPYYDKIETVVEAKQCLSVVLAMGKGVVDVPGWKMVVTIPEKEVSA